MRDQFEETIHMAMGLLNDARQENIAQRAELVNVRQMWKETIDENVKLHQKLDRIEARIERLLNIIVQHHDATLVTSLEWGSICPVCAAHQDELQEFRNDSNASPV